MSKRILNFLILFLLFYLTFQLFFGQRPTQPPPADSRQIVFETSKSSYSLGSVVELNIKNNTNARLTFKNDCPNEPFTVFYTSEGTQQKTYKSPINCKKEVDPATKDITVNPGDDKTLRYTFWSASVFDKTGKYKIVGTFDVKGEKIRAESNEFQITQPGFFKNLWVSGFYQPMYNFLMGLIYLVPGNRLGLAIIILTLILRIILFVPSQKALKSQKKLAEVQPKLNHIKEKYKNDQQKMAEETMKIWKENKVNPLGSCLPILVQFPILIALFYVIRDGLNPDKAHLLYSFMKDMDFTLINTMFLNIMPLTTKNTFVLPIIVGGLQFFQLKLSMHLKPDGKKDKKKSDAQKVQRMMMYFMPVLIAVFTASLPAGVGLYWGTSTLFGIGQQFYVNKKS